MTRPRLVPKPREAATGNQGERYLGLRGKVVDWAEHVFEEGMLYVRVRFKDKTELCWVLQTAHVIVEADLSDWKSGDCKQLAIYVQNEGDWQ